MANNIKRAILNGSVFIHLKQRNYRLKMYQTRVTNVLLNEISHSYKISCIAILQGVNLPHPPFKIQGLT